MGELVLAGVVLSPDGKERLHFQRRGPGSDAEAIGRDLADELLKHGAERLIAKS